MGKQTEEQRKECRRVAGELYDTLARVGITLYGLHMEAPQDDHHAHEIIGGLKTHITYRRIKDEKI